MLYSAEKGNPTSTFRGKTWQLPNNGYWRACNYNGQQCSFKLYNEAIRFAAKGKTLTEDGDFKSKPFMKPIKSAEFIASWDGVPVHRLSPKQQEVLASIGNSMGATGGPLLTKRNLRGWNRLVAIDTIKQALRDASPEGRKLATPILKILQKDKGGLQEGLTRNQAWSQFKSEVLPGIKKKYEQNGRPDKPARREAWNNYVDSLARDGSVSEKAADGWGHPRGLETEGVLQEKEAKEHTVSVSQLHPRERKKLVPLMKRHGYTAQLSSNRLTTNATAKQVDAVIYHIDEAYPRDPGEFNPSNAQLMPGGKRVKTTKELKYSRSKNPVTVPVGTTIELKFSKDKPQFGYFQYGGSQRATQLALAHKSLTGISKPPSTGKLQKMGFDGIATTPTGQRVEPDGHGRDGSPSWLLVLGMI